jgi:hypothetical protein
MRSVRRFVALVLVSRLVVVTGAASPASSSGGEVSGAGFSHGARFRRIATFPVYRNNADPGVETVAEIIDVTPDGRTLVYTDAPLEQIGFVNITRPDDPQPGGTVPVGGEPTSVATTKKYALASVNTSESYTSPSGRLAVIDVAARTEVHSIDLAGQPDSIKISPDGRYAAIVIENERDEDIEVDGVEGGLPQPPPGLLQIVRLVGPPTAWTVRDVDLTGLAEIAPDDPEPEFVDINQRNLAVVTLQENNHLVVVHLPSGQIVNHFSAGTVDLTGIDTVEDGVIDPTGSLSDVPREPDAVSWIDQFRFATANEGDLFGGSRGFTVFGVSGHIYSDSGNEVEHLAIRYGQYPEDRSENKGAEPEGVEHGRFGGKQQLFVASERGNFVAVYDVGRADRPRFLQFLPTAIGPESVLAIPKRGLLVVTSEADDPPFGVRTGISIYRYSSRGAEYPQLASVDGPGGAPISWGALSGLVADPHDSRRVLAVSDSAYSQGFVYEIDTKRSPALIVGRTTVQGGSGDFDFEGITVAPDGTRWIASEGNAGDSRPNRLLQVDDAGQVLTEVGLPPEVLACRAASTNRGSLGAGFEGVTAVPADGGYLLYVAQQRGWDYTTPDCEALDDDPEGNDSGEPGWTRIWVYDPATGEWSHIPYQLEPVPANAAWVGLSEITALDDGRFMLIERDNLSGDFSELKWLTFVDLDGSVVRNDKLHRDLLPPLAADNGWFTDKPEGAAVTRNGQVFVVTDNDGLDDSTGETQFLRLGSLRRLRPVPSEDIDVQVLALNDFHGNLGAPGGSSGRVGTVDAGGAEYLATHVAALRATNPSSIVVSAGDLIGSSPLLSALFHDEPTIEAMNQIGLDLNAVGNHEFDEGTTELLRMQNGGCHPVDGCQDGDDFAGADFGFLAANVVDDVSGDPLFPPYSIEDLGGARVAFIGMTLEGTPTIVSAAGIAGWEFRDEADTVNALVPELEAQGVEAIVVLLHEGGVPASFDINGCAASPGRSSTSSSASTTRWTWSSAATPTSPTTA